MATHHKKEGKKVQHWKTSDDMNYHFFLVLRYNRFVEGKPKIQNIFKDMEMFLGKESTKCRSHHQKKMKGYQTVADLLRGFYNNFYKIRCLDIDHFTKEFQSFLKEKQTHEHGIDSSEHDRYIQQFVSNLRHILQEPPQPQQLVHQVQSTLSPSQKQDSKQDSKQLKMRRIETHETQNLHYLHQYPRRDSQEELQDVFQGND